MAYYVASAKFVRRMICLGSFFSGNRDDNMSAREFE